MKFSRRPSGPKHTITITLTRKSLFVGLLFVVLSSQAVAIYASANAAQSRGSSVNPGQEVSTFLSTLVLYLLVGVGLIVTLAVAFYVARISPASDSSRPQRAIARGGFGLMGVVIVLVTAYLTKSYWQNVQLASMLIVPVFYMLLGGTLRLCYKRLKRGRPVSEPRQATSSKLWSDSDTGPLAADAMAH